MARCHHALSTPPAPRFINPPPGLFWLRQCLGHCTCLSTAQCKFFFLLFCLCSLRLCCPFVLCLLSRAASVLLCHIHSFVPCLHPHLRCINPPSPGLSWLHRCPDLCTPCRMPRSSLMPLHCTLCSVCIVPPPPPTPLPHLMRVSVSVPVQLYTCYFTCIRIRL